MTDRYPGALLVSLMLHGAIAGLMLLAGYAAGWSKPDSLVPVELVAGFGDNYGATEAPALGDPAALKMDLPKPPAAEVPKPREVAPPEPEPVAPPVAEKPAPKPVEEKPLPKPRDIGKAIEKQIARAETKTKATLAKQHEVELKKTTKEAHDKEQAAKKKIASATPAGAPKITKIDTVGIREGVVGGSTKNDKGGAGGKALVRDDGPVLDAYFALLKERLRAALDKPPGLSDSLVTIVQMRINPDGSLTGARITKASGSEEFDAAVMAAVAATRMPPHPEKKSEILNIPFRMKELDQG
ncbi:MAG: TonB family protein [Opitutaceae bacterium]